MQYFFRIFNIFPAKNIWSSGLALRYIIPTNQPTIFMSHQTWLKESAMSFFYHSTPFFLDLQYCLLPRRTFPEFLHVPALTDIDFWTDWLLSSSRNACYIHIHGEHSLRWSAMVSQCWGHLQLKHTCAQYTYKYSQVKPHNLNCGIFTRRLQQIKNWWVQKTTFKGNWQKCRNVKHKMPYSWP